MRAERAISANFGDASTFFAGVTMGLRGPRVDPRPFAWETPPGTMFKKLFGAVVDGFGHTAGKVLFDQAVRRAKDELREPTEEERAAEEAKAKEAALKEEKRLAKEAEKAERERVKAAAKASAEIDEELAALKKKLRK
jgi:hypothetical protein